MFDKKEYVYAVYKEKSFTAAAEKLYLSQPCLSAAIKKTEQQIGLPLFERKPGGLTPTRIGYEYLACAEKIMDIEQSFISMLDDINGLKAGSIRIGSATYICSYVLPAIVSHFSKQYPNIDISIYEANSLELEKMLRNEKIDLMIDSFDDIDEQFDSTPLIGETILLAVPAACRCNANNLEYAVRAEDIYYGRVDVNSLPELDLLHFQDEKFILLKSGHNMYQHAQAAFDAAGFVPSVSFRLDQLNTSFRLVTTGNGLCFVTDTMFKTHLHNDDVVFYRVKGAGTRTMYAANNRQSHSAVIIQKFKEIAWNVMQHLPLIDANAQD